MRKEKETQCLKALIPTEHKLSTDWHQSAKFPLSSWAARAVCALNGWAETVSNRYEKKLIFYFKNTSYPRASWHFTEIERLNDLFTESSEVQ